MSSSNVINDIILQSYSEKSFVLKGNTRPQKEDIKKLGGKYNSKLTDHLNSTQFSGWIFPKSKEEIVSKWLKTGKLDEESITNTSYSSSQLQRIEDKLDRILVLLGEKNNPLPSKPLNNTGHKRLI